MKTRTLTTLSVSLVAGLAASALTMFVAWNHNPQGAFHEPGLGGSEIIHWGDWPLIGVGWFVPVFVATWIVLMIAIVVVLTISKLAERRRVSRPPAEPGA